MKNKDKIHKIPTLPDVVKYKYVCNYVYGLSSIPIGIEKNELNICSCDFTSNIGSIITSNKLSNTTRFVQSLIELFSKINGMNIITFDVSGSLNLDKSKYPNYFTTNLETSLQSVNSFIDNTSNFRECVILINGVDKFLNKIGNKQLFENLFEIAKKQEHISIIVIEDVVKFRKYSFDPWFTANFNTSEGIWVGRGISDQSLIHLGSITKEMLQDIKNDMGYYVSEGVATLVKYIDFMEDEDEK